MASIYLSTEEGYGAVLRAAKRVKQIEAGWWIFAKKIVIGKTEFTKAFSDNLTKMETFAYSGYALLELEEIGRDNMAYAIPGEFNGENELDSIFGYGGYVLRTGMRLAMPSTDVIRKHLDDKGQGGRDAGVDAVMAAYDFFNRASGMAGGGHIALIGLG